MTTQRTQNIIKIKTWLTAKDAEVRRENEKTKSDGENYFFDSVKS